MAADQSRLPQGNIVGSGGWRAPSETVYELTDIACPETLRDAPEIQLARGGLRFVKIPSLDVGSMTFVHTEADDISGAVKTCFKNRLPGAGPLLGVFLEAGSFTQRHFSELVTWHHDGRARTPRASGLFDQPWPPQPFGKHLTVPSEVWVVIGPNFMSPDATG